MTADTPPPSTTPAATVRLSGLRVGQIVTLTGTVRTVTQLVPDDHRRVTLDCDPMDQPALPDDSLATALADLDRAERRLAAVEALVGKWEASAVEAESIAQARIGIADVMDYLVAAVVRRQCARDLNTALAAEQPTAGGDEARR